MCLRRILINISFTNTNFILACYMVIQKYNFLYFSSEIKPFVFYYKIPYPHNNEYYLFVNAPLE